MLLARLHTSGPVFAGIVRWQVILIPVLKITGGLLTVCKLLMSRRIFGTYCKNQ